MEHKIINYAHIRESLALILKEETFESTGQRILESLDDALANNSDSLMVTNDPSLLERLADLEHEQESPKEGK